MLITASLRTDYIYRMGLELHVAVNISQKADAIALTPIWAVRSIGTSKNYDPSRAASLAAR